jgi:hyperosmotically inducible periplasmic protein
MCHKPQTPDELSSSVTATWQTTVEYGSRNQLKYAVLRVRQAVMKDGSLSMNAKNVKIIARDGTISLKGPVDSQREKDTIATSAGEIAGKDKVDNQLEVKAANK